jgi:hypothetical protein
MDLGESSGYVASLLVSAAFDTAIAVAGRAVR